ncbi:MAG: ABC transporter substrate-binding protein [Tagaea sp.]
MKRRHFLAAGTAALAAPALARAQGAETRQVRISIQPGMSMMPLVVARERGTVEARLRQAGLPGQVAWNQISGGPAMNDALLSDSIDFASGGSPGMFILWERARNSRNEVRGLASMASIPQMLYTRTPNVKSVADFTARDRIAVPSVGVGHLDRDRVEPVPRLRAPLLGRGHLHQHDLQSHAEATVALSAPVATEITAHMSGPPQQWAQMKDPKLTRVFESTEIVGGPATQNIMWAKTAFRNANPRTTKAVLDGVDDAMAFCRSNLREAVEIFLKATNSNQDTAELAQNLRDPNVTFDTTPARSMFFAEFMARVGQLKAMPADWKEVWMPELHDRRGS